MSTVYTQPFSTAGNGGRKLVRLSNGWLVTTVLGSFTGLAQYIYVYMSKNNGDTWEYFNNITYYKVISFSIVEDGTKIHILTTLEDNATGDNKITEIRTYDVANTTEVVSNYIIDQKQTEIGNCSIAIDSTNGHLHGAWSSKNRTYNNSFNIRYSKSIDGGITWSLVEQVTNYNFGSYPNAFISPSINLDENSLPYISASQESSGIRDTKNVDANRRSIILLKKSLELSSHTYVNTSWSYAHIYTINEAYLQTSSLLTSDKDGVLTSVWHGYDSSHPTTFYVRFSKSVDSGNSWSTMQKLVQGRNASFSTDKNNKYVISYEDGGVIKQISSVNKGDTWSSPVTIGIGTNPNNLYDNTFAGQFGETASTVHMTTSSVEYIGSYTTNQAPTISVKKVDNTQINNNDTITIPRESNYQFKLTINDSDEGQSLTYQIKVNNVITTDFTPITNSIETEITIDKSSFISGMNSLDIIARDDQGGESTFRFNIIVNENLPIDSSCLANMKFNGYSLSTISLAELVNFLE